MTHPIPPGTRDVLPDEMRELRVLTDRLRAAFERAGYEEVWTTGDDRAAGAGYRLFDEHGEVLAMRSDMTIPIARVVASRYRDAEPPFRFCYFAHAYREVERGVGEPREFLQGGVELIGMPGTEDEHLPLLERLSVRDLVSTSGPPRSSGWRTPPGDCSHACPSCVAAPRCS